MNKRKKTFLFCLFFAGILLMNAGFVYALETTYPPIFGLGIGNGTLPEYAKYFFNIGIFIAVTLAVVIIAFGGIYYLIDLGRGKFTDEAKSWIKAGVIGLLITVSAYLMAYTINPALVVFDLKGLAPLTFLANFFNPNQDNNTPVEVFTEIPIGTLTENLLTPKIDCYDFDGNGDPVPGEEIITDNNKKIIGPTYLEHDAVDCILKLGEAAEKKAKIVQELSDKIINLMDKCSCANSNLATKPSDVCKNPFCSTNTDNYGQTADCKYPSAPNCPENPENYIGSTEPCQDTCSNKSCSGTGDCCPKDSGVQNPKNRNKNFSVKELIDSGPIAVSDCNNQNKDYKGLDEFESQYGGNYELIKTFVETQPSPIVKDKKISVIKNGDCSVCENKQSQQDLSKCLEERKKCLEENSQWYNLRLVDQLTYLKGKIEEIKEKIQKNLENLENAETSMGQCYLADSYIDFLQTYQKTNKEEKIIITERTFSDPETNQLITPTKYCEGFQYENSSCYSQCQKVCPGTGEVDINCYKKAKNIDEAKECFNNRICIPNASPFNTFQECFSACKQSCKDSCNALCGQEKDNCIKKCDSNSKCITENADKCLVNFEQAQQCALKSTDEGTLKNCMQTATLCPYCTDQYAGYAECLKNPYSTQENYSSSFIYQNQNYQICPQPYKAITTNSGDITNCLTLYPETAKCPASSKCPECPCDIIEETTTDYQICSGDCDEFSYNDDPLTFYCQQSWWLKKEEVKKETPIGQERICPKEREIPVGQTVDNAEKWAQNFIDNIDEFTKKIQEMISYMDNIAKEQNYCQCNSKCDAPINKEPACQAKCVFQYTEGGMREIILPDGTPYTQEMPEKCYCSRQSTCTGNPCQKIIHLLKGKTSQQDCPKGVEYKGIAYFANQINLRLMSGVVITRSEALKQLNYSREKTNECSVVQNNYGDQTKMLSCTRVLHEIISPINDKNNQTIIGDKTFDYYCYGKELGDILKTEEPMADNWFCCENRKKE